MRILIDVTEAAERLEELIELSLCGDEILICRAGEPVAMLTPMAQKTTPYEDFVSLAVNRRRNGTLIGSPKGTPASSCIGSARVGPGLSI